MEAGNPAQRQSEYALQVKSASCNGQANINKAPKNVVKKRGRPPKTKVENGTDGVPLKQTKVTDTLKKTKRTVDRYASVECQDLFIGCLFSLLFSLIDNLKLCRLWPEDLKF